MLLRFILLIISIIASESSKKVLEEFNLWDPKAFKLTDETFSKSISEGDWIVFFGSKYCTHCQAFTPDWVKFQDVVKEKYDPIVRIAKVECTASPNLCDKVLAYPTLNIYRSAKFVEEIQVYDIENVQKIVQKIYNERKKLSKDDAKYVLEQYLDDSSKRSLEWNTDGKVVHLTQDDFKDQTKDKAWMLMFHAPVFIFD